MLHLHNNLKTPFIQGLVAGLPVFLPGGFRFVRPQDQRAIDDQLELTTSAGNKHLLNRLAE